MAAAESMQFRRSGQRDERRRRVLRDDPSDGKSGDADAVNKTGKTDAVARAYSRAAVAETETRVADLIPVRPGAVAMLALLGLAAAVGVETLYVMSIDWKASMSADSLAALDVAAKGSLAGWFSSLLLGLSAVAASLVYIIRRYKVDDYGGRYRLWLWAAGLLALASVDAGTNLHLALAAGWTKATGFVLGPDGAGWWMLSLAVVYGAMGLRAAIDMRRSRGAVAALIAGAAAYAVAGFLIWTRPLLDPMLSAMAGSSCSLIAHLALLLSMGLFARYVLLDARGLLPVRPNRRRRKQKPVPKDGAETKAAGEKKLRVDPPLNKTTRRKRRTDVDGKPTAQSKAAKTKTAAKTTSAKAKTSSPAAEADDDAETASDEHGPLEGSPEWLKLNKSERRRVKKLRRRAA